MAQKQVEEPSLSVTDRSYAVGFTETGDTTDELLQQVLQASLQGFDVLVAVPDVNTETTDWLAQSPTQIVDIEPGDNSRDTLISAASERDYDGIVLYTPGESIQFEKAVERLNGSSEFVVDAGTLAEEEEQVGRLIGIPAYNEAVSIGSMLLQAQHYADEVVVIDDGSTDSTVDVAEQTGATVLEHESNRGKGRAIQTFFNYAQSSDHDLFVILDGDGQHLPENIPTVAEAVEAGDADIVVGSRYLEDSGGEETPFHRRVGQQVLDYLTLGSSGTKLTDTQSGFRAFSPTAIDELSLRTDGMGVESEMVASAQDSDLTIEEVPIDVRYEDVDGQTLNPVTHGLGVAAFLLQLIRDRHPLVFYGGPGIVFAGIGMYLGADALLLYGNQDTFAVGQVVTGMLLLNIGLLGLFSGLVLNRMSDMITEPSEEIQ